MAKRKNQDDKGPQRRYHCIRGDAIDERVWAETVQNNQLFSALINRAEQKLPTFYDLTEDFWRSLIKPVPQIEVNGMPASHVLNALILSSIAGTPDWHRFRDFTQYDPDAAIMGAIDIGEQVYESLPDDVLDGAQAAAGASGQSQSDEGDAQKSQSEADQAKKDAEDAQKKAGENPGDGQSQQDAEQKQQDAEQKQQQADDARKKADQSKQEEQKAREDFEQLIEQPQNKSNIEQATQQALKDSLDALEKAQGLGWGKDPGSRPNVPLEQRMKIARMLTKNPKFKQVVNEAGRYRRFALNRQKRKTNYGADEITNIERGKDLSRILPSELKDLGREEMKNEFYRKYADSALLQYKMEGVEVLSKGPILVAFDGSGSMQGDPEIWAKAFTLGCYWIAKRQKRPFAAAQFGSHYELESWEFPKSITATKEAELIESMAGFFFCGGTDFDRPLEWALEKIQESRFKKADLIFVSDGYCRADASTVEKIKKAREDGLRVISVFVGGAGDYYRFSSSDMDSDSDGVPESLKVFSDSGIAINNFRDDEDARELAYSI